MLQPKTPTSCIQRMKNIETQRMNYGILNLEKYLVSIKKLQLERLENGVINKFFKKKVWTFEVQK